MNPLYYVINKYANDCMRPVDFKYKQLKFKGRVFCSVDAVGIYMLGRALGEHIILKQDEQGVRVFDLIEPDMLKFEKQLAAF